MAKVSLEVAKQELDRFIDSLGLDAELDADLLDNEEQQAILIKAIQKGRLLIDEDGNASIDFIYTNKKRETPLAVTQIKSSGELFFALTNGGVTPKVIATATGLLENQVKNLDARDNMLISSVLAFFILG